MSNLAFRIENMRPVTGKGILFAFTDIVFGVDDGNEFVGLFVVKDFALKATKDGGYWLQSPGKLRVGKDGEPLLKDGYKQYIDYFDLHFTDGAGKDGGRGAVKAAWDFKRRLVAAAADAYEKLAATKGPTPGRGQAVAAGVTEDNDPGVPFDSEEDDLPF